MKRALITIILAGVWLFAATGWAMVETQGVFHCYKDAPCWGITTFINDGWEYIILSEKTETKDHLNQGWILIDTKGYSGELNMGKASERFSFACYLLKRSIESAE